jgi:hypothetical protein
VNHYIPFDFDSWRKELLFTGNIVQDGDNSVPQADRDQRFNRYVELVDTIRGNEGVEVFVELMNSLQAKDDYGAYQGTYQALRRFPPAVAAKGLTAALPALISRQRDCAGDILCQLANATSTEARAALSEFRRELAKADAQTQTVIMSFVGREENGGWLDGRRKGLIKPG